MKIKITVKKDTEADRIIKEYPELKTAFNKAAGEGRAPLTPTHRSLS